MLMAVLALAYGAHAAAADLQSREDAWWTGPMLAAFPTGVALTGLPPF